jgi:NAD(P)-dependent dehydrogenase (short-subunit alcohol dehydrogenase family)
MNLNDLTQLYDFTGRTILVTGGTGVLGSEMVRALAGCNANVAVLSRKPALKERVIQHQPESEGHVLHVYGDVLQPDTLEQAAAAVAAEWGPLYGLINAAGGITPGAYVGPGQSFFDLAPEAILANVNLNLMGTLVPCQVFGRQMVAQGEGVILNVASLTSLRPLTRAVAYGAGKAAVANFTQWLAVHLAQDFSPRIRVNAIAPGFFVTELNRHLLTNVDTGELTARGQAIMSHSPQGRFGVPEDLSGAVLWLMSPASAFVTGIVLPVDGGFMAYAGV